MVIYILFCFYLSDIRPKVKGYFVELFKQKKEPKLLYHICLKLRLRKILLTPLFKEIHHNAEHHHHNPHKSIWTNLLTI